MKILIFAPFFPPDPTGSSIFASDQCTELARREHDVFVVTNRQDPRAPQESLIDLIEDLPHYKVERIKAFRFNMGKITWDYYLPFSTFGFLRPALFRKIKSFDADAVIVHSTLFDLSLWALIWCAVKGKKTVLVSHTALWHDQKFVNFMMRMYGRTVVRLLVKLSKSQVVCVDKWTHENALKLFSKSTNTTTIPVSVNLGTMSGGDAQRVRFKHELGSGPIVLSLGHVVPLRDRINLVRSLPSLISKYPNLKVVIVGMVQDKRFLDLAESLGVRDHLVLVGPVAHTEIKDYLAMADVETHDLDGRGLGITSVEAMDAGVPIVAWVDDNNYPGVSLRGYGQNGFIDDGEPTTIARMISLMLRDERYRESAIQSQFALVKDIYSVESVTSHYLALLN